MKHKLLLVPFVLALAGAGCGGGSTPEATGSNPAPAVAPVAVSSNCTNPYYPFKVGSKISYKTKSGSTSSTYSVEVQQAATADAFKLAYLFESEAGSMPVAQEFTCESGVIRAKGQLDMPSVAGGASISYTTNSVDGPFLPSDMNVGTKWDTTYNVTMHTTNPVLAKMMDGKNQSTHIKSEVIGEESVTVPAGTYTALKVKMNVEIKSDISKQPMGTTSEMWFVKGIGMVKSISGTGATKSVTEASVVSGF
ncbi:MAG: hypothetical protein WCK01_04995 [Candidatus Uhrbacteria bacterium]